MCCLCCSSRRRLIQCARSLLVVLTEQCVAVRSRDGVSDWCDVCVQGSEAESVNGPGQDSGLDTASRHEPSATLPGRVEAPEAMEGMLCRKQEMESQGKKAANRSQTHHHAETTNVILQHTIALTHNTNSFISQRATRGRWRLKLFSSSSCACA